MYFPTPYDRLVSSHLATRSLRSPDHPRSTNISSPKMVVVPMRSRMTSRINLTPAVK